jgi:hypothetical protein
VEELIPKVYQTIFQKKKSLHTLLFQNQKINELDDFLQFYQTLFKNQYYVYISNSMLENISQLRMGRNINISKPLYFSIHQMKLSEYEPINRFLLRAKSNEDKGENQNQNEETRYTQEELNQIIQIIQKRLYQNEELNKTIRTNKTNLQNSSALISKLKNLHRFELFLLLVYKTYQKQIFTLHSSFMHPRAKNILTLI